MKRIFRQWWANLVCEWIGHDPGDWAWPPFIVGTNGEKVYCARPPPKVCRRCGHEVAAPLPPPETPELAKMKAVVNDSHKLGAFLDWLEEQGIQLAARHEHNAYCYDEVDIDQDPPVGSGDLQCGMEESELELANTGGIEKLLARYFEIDLNKVDAEKRDLLEWHRASTGQLRQEQDQRQEAFQ